MNDGILANINKGSTNRLENIVKKHVFLPSGKLLWEIKGKKNEHVYYINSALKFCSCKGFYYNYNRKKCYHLTKITHAIELAQYSIFIHNDDNLDKMLKKIVIDIILDN